MSKVTNDGLPQIYIQHVSKVANEGLPQTYIQYVSKVTNEGLPQTYIQNVHKITQAYFQNVSKVNNEGLPQTYIQNMSKVTNFVSSQSMILKRSLVCQFGLTFKRQKRTICASTSKLTICLYNILIYCSHSVVFCFILLIGLVKLKIHLEINGYSAHVHVWLLAVPFINSYSAHVHVWLLTVPFINSYQINLSV